MAMSYVQSTERALQGGIDRRVVDAKVVELSAALRDLAKAYAERTLPLLHLPERKDDLKALAPVAAELRKSTDIVFLGTGGSSLGGQTLAQLAFYHVPGLASVKPPRVHFVDNLDADTFALLLRDLALGSTRFVAISKSGGTAETLMQTMAARAALKNAGVDRLGDHFLGLTEPMRAEKRNGLRDLLADIDAPILEHDPGIGGRFSALSNVGMLPALVMGLNGQAVRDGAAEVMRSALDARPADFPPAIGAALSVAAAQTSKPITVLLAYSDRLERFSHWWVQLWAESLGKHGRGTTPIAALGPVDQHSQLQLYLAGPADKLFTVISVDSKGRGPRIDAASAETGGEKILAGRTLGDLVAAEARATVETLAAKGAPVRTIALPALNEHALGALLMHFMLETILAARLLGVDPFDQPAVEEGKVLAKRYLAE